MKTYDDSTTAADIRLERISYDRAMDDLLYTGTAELMFRADQIRRARHSRKVHFVHSLNINPTNLCTNQCKLCAFWKDNNSQEGYVLTLEQATQRLHEAVGWGLTDLHVVGGLTEQLGLDYFLQLFQKAKEILPSVVIQGLTAVEIHWLAGLEKMSVWEVLKGLKAAGLDAIPGGGAEIFNGSVRKEICPGKIRR